MLRSLVGSEMCIRDRFRSHHIPPSPYTFNCKRSSIMIYADIYPSFIFKNVVDPVLHQLDQKIIYPHYDFKHLTEKYFEIGMKLNDFSIQLVKYCSWGVIFILFDSKAFEIFLRLRFVHFISLSIGLPAVWSLSLLKNISSIFYTVSM